MNFREQAPDTPAKAVDPRYATARDAAIRSFFNRFGRFPTEDEFRQSIGHFLPRDLRRMAMVEQPERHTPEAGSRVVEKVDGAVNSQSFGNDAIRWLLQQRYGRMPTPDEVNDAMQGYRQSARRSPAVSINVDSPRVDRRQSPLRPPPFERTPLFASPTSFHERATAGAAMAEPLLAAGPRA